MAGPVCARFYTHDTQPCARPQIEDGSSRYIQVGTCLQLVTAEDGSSRYIQVGTGLQLVTAA